MGNRQPTLQNLGEFGELEQFENPTEKIEVIRRLIDDILVNPEYMITQFKYSKKAIDSLISNLNVITLPSIRKTAFDLLDILLDSDEFLHIFLFQKKGCELLNIYSQDPAISIAVATILLKLTLNPSYLNLLLEGGMKVFLSIFIFGGILSDIILLGMDYIYKIKYDESSGNTNPENFAILQSCAQIISHLCESQDMEILVRSCSFLIKII